MNKVAGSAAEAVAGINAGSSLQERKHIRW
jgi:hypothetical protein